MSNPAASASCVAVTNSSRIRSIPTRSSASGTWFSAVHGTLDGATTCQLPFSSGLSIPSHATRVEPLEPLWPSCMQMRAPGWVWTKSVMRFHASTCSSFHMPVQPGVMRPSGDTQVISVTISPAPPSARAP